MKTQLTHMHTLLNYCTPSHGLSARGGPVASAGLFLVFVLKTEQMIVCLMMMTAAVDDEW